MSLSWYALQVRPNFETRVRSRLQDAAVEAYFPFTRVVSRDKRRVNERNLFPGYVFARFEQDTRAKVLALPELIRIVGAGSHALTIPDQEIASVKLISTKPGATVCGYLPASGDWIKISSGPLAGLEGAVVYMRESKNRVRLTVSVHMLQRSISAEVDADNVQLLRRAA